MIPARNSIDAHAQRCLANGELLLTLNLLTTTIVAPPSNASKWQMGFNSAFKGLKVNITLEQAAKARKGSRGIAVLFL